MKKNTQAEIRKALDNVDYCDYHFHWEKDEEYPNGSFKNTGNAIRNPMELLMQDYAGAELLSSEGFPREKTGSQWQFISECVNNEKSAYQKAQPFFKKVESSPGFQAALRGFKILYNMPELDLSNPLHYFELSKRVREAYKNGILDWLPNAYKRGKINRSINIWTTRYGREHFDNLSDKDKKRELDLLPPTFRFDYFLVLPFRYQKAEDVAKWFWEAVHDVKNMEPVSFNISSHISDITSKFKSMSFDGYLRYVDKTFDFFKERGTHELKSACCFKRTLEFRERKEADARRAYKRLCSEFIGTNSEIKDYEEDIRTFEDFIFYRCLALAREKGWNTIQIHTGFRRLKPLSDGRPSHLAELIEKNPQTNFIILHAGVHFYKDLIDLCRRYSNVTADFTCLPMEPELARKAVREFIENMPYRTSAGLDMANVEGSAGMADIVRDLVAEILNELVNERKIGSVEEAVRIGKSIISERAKELFPNSFIKN